ncbi:hypothetical protein M8C21_022818, partial [Ambrosia artemisiifolia]
MALMSGGFDYRDDITKTTHLA